MKMSEKREGIIILLIVFILSAFTTAFAFDVRIIWDASTSQDIVSYNIYRSLQSGTYTASNKVGTVGRDVLEYVDSNLDKGNVYYYVITAENDGGIESDYSDEISVEPFDYGDVNGDGTVTPGDALLVLKIYDQSISPDLKQKYSADMTHDGVITPMDALCALKKFIKEDDPTCE